MRSSPISKAHGMMSRASSRSLMTRSRNSTKTSTKRLQWGRIGRDGMHDDNLRALLKTLGPKARDDLRRVLIYDKADRDAVSSHLPRYRDVRGDDWGEIIDMLTMHPETRRKVVPPPPVAA